MFISLKKHVRPSKLLTNLSPNRYNLILILILFVLASTKQNQLDIKISQHKQYKSLFAYSYKKLYDSIKHQTTNIQIVRNDKVLASNLMDGKQVIVTMEGLSNDEYKTLIKQHQQKLSAHDKSQPVAKQNSNPQIIDQNLETAQQKKFSLQKQQQIKIRSYQQLKNQQQQIKSQSVKGQQPFTVSKPSTKHDTLHIVFTLFIMILVLFLCKRQLSTTFVIQKSLVTNSSQTLQGTSLVD